MFSRELTVAIEAALAAGAAIRGYYQDSYTVKEKGQDNPLTDADLASNQIIFDRMRSEFPTYGWFSEESVDDESRLTAESVWIVDPLDGTKEFTLGIPEFVVSIALIVANRPAVGVLYNPIKDELYSGVVGQGAQFNRVACAVSSHAGLQGARIVCSRTEMKKGWFDKYLDIVSLQPVGSVAYKFGRVAAGQAEATFTPQPRNEWDIAAGVALVEAAGGRATNRLGEPFLFNQRNPLVNGICATNGVVHPEILGLMA